MSTSQETIRSLALDIIDNYRKAANSSVGAFRSASSLGLGKVDTLLTQYEGKLGKAVKGRLSATQKQFDTAAELADATVDVVSSSVKSAIISTQEKILSASAVAEKNVDKLVGNASQRLAKFPAKGGKFADLLQSKTIKTIDQFGFGVPTAKVLQYVSSAVADGAQQLASKVAVAPKKAPVVRKTVRKVAAKKRARA